MNLIAKILLKELFSTWNEWQKYKTFYVKELLPSIFNDPFKGTVKERKITETIKNIVPNLDLAEVAQFSDDIYSITTSIEESLMAKLNAGDLGTADIIYECMQVLHENQIPPFQYNLLRDEVISRLTEDLKGLLKMYKFEQAELFYNTHKKEVSSEVYKKEVKYYQSQYKKILLLQKAEDLLGQNLMNDADFLINNLDKSLEIDHLEVIRDYEVIKMRFISQDLRNLEEVLNDGKVPGERIYFDEEKADVLSATGNNILVQARAGSGKTTVIALKVRQLIKFHGIKPEEILVLAFNNKAADEFRSRIDRYCGDGTATEANTLTFHALAKRIANTEKVQLVDKKSYNNEYNRHGKDETLQIDFMQECFNKVEHRERSTIGKLFYLFLKAASEKIKGAFRNDNEYYLYLRNQEYTTIAGEFVKSVGEKYIADFLFEHRISKDEKDLEYAYERNIKKHLGTKYTYNPDFSLFYADDKQREQLQAVIEYFGFTKKNPGYPGFFDTKEESLTYLKGSDEKKSLFIDENISFIEMSADDFDEIKTNSSLDEHSVRDQFEIIIKTRLIKEGFTVSSRLSEKEVLEKITNVERRKKDLVKQIVQFINKAQKLSYEPDDIRRLATHSNLGMRNECFIKIACRVYEEYRFRLEQDGFTDFDGLFIDAINKIKKHGTGCGIIYHGEQEIGNIKYILIDEYQDFTELFYKLIDQIRSVNPLVSFFCVGDDWQAINGFAGSDLQYFDEFETRFFKGGRRVNLLTNYRSYKNIILHSNLLMAGRGLGGEPEPDKPDGSVYLSELSRVELRNNQEYTNEYTKDKKYRDAASSLLDKDDTSKSTPLELARYLKTVEYIMSNKVSTEKQVCLIFRANKIHGVSISKFADKIGEWCPKRPKTLKKKVKERDVLVNIDYSTAHSFKGKEADVVIIIGVNQRGFPKFHPDNELMEVLGVTHQQVRDEEQRLFYVAITRAKEELYLLYDSGQGLSDFVDPEEWKYSQI